MAFERELSVAQAIVDETDPIAMRHFALTVPTQIKADGTPVTVADRAVEETIRRALESAFAGDAILGEEQGASGESARRWIIDPIDGTKNYARGVPVFATLIALEVDGALVLGMVSAPALGARWWATAGDGAFANGARITVSGVDNVAAADVVTGGLDWARDNAGGLFQLFARARRQRGFGDFWGHMLVAQGSAEVMVECAPLALWDIAAPRLIVEEAGGRVTDLTGDPTFQAGSALSTNGALHDEVLGLLREEGPPVPR